MNFSLDLDSSSRLRVTAFVAEGNRLVISTCWKVLDEELR